MLSTLALVLGIAIALVFGNPRPEWTRVLAHRLLALSVIGVGFGVDLSVIGRVGARGTGYTAIGIALTFVVGHILTQRLRVARDTGLLITAGTAVCGGSAIAAVAPTINASPQDTSVALAAVFLLNAIALVVFPVLGHHVGLDENQFGLWSALAIHDTSSVVGAAGLYGARALEVATAAKLARALWIIPVTLVIASRRASTVRLKPPWFIAGFVVAAAAASYMPALRSIAGIAHYLMAGTLLLIGLGLTRTSLRSLGMRPLLLAVLLWIVIASATLAAIMGGWIS